MSILKWVGLGGGTLVAGIAAAVTFGSITTENDILAFQDRIEQIASETNPAQSAEISQLPSPVQRYFEYAFPDGIPPATLVRLTAEGQFRRPQTETFNHTTAEQVIAIREPALMFSATTPVLPGVWARAYDFFANGEMEMKAKVVSLVTVVDEKETPELNVISLRRWLLESALYPHSLLPGGPVTWQAIDDSKARAIVSDGTMSAAMVAHFDQAGRITKMTTEEDGDLNTPYHGSGEHVTRDDYRLVDGAMIPHRFVISRASGAEVLPFFDAKITSISFE